MGLSINNKEYFYIKDILENTIGIIDQERNVVVYYRYDAYGKLLQEKELGWIYYIRIAIPSMLNYYKKKKYGFGDWKHMFKCGVEYLKSEANWLYKIFF